VNKVIELEQKPQQGEEAPSVPKFPVVEIFGPTVQGEGIDQGIPVHFIRLGGCDYKCDWCDSPHAVLPISVRAAPRMNAYEIMRKIRSLPPGPQWIVLSGGNPALHQLDNLLTILNTAGYKVAIETQGTKYKDWIKRCDRICVSPKPPSANQEFHMSELTSFMRNMAEKRTFLKVVVFDGRDYDFARFIHSAFPMFPMFVSAGNDAGSTVANPQRKDERTQEQVVNDLIVRGRWLANRVMVDRHMSDVRVQVQNHVLYWGNERGR
jgi:7-carboxy-7-deazaguanine synthase